MIIPSHDIFAQNKRPEYFAGKDYYAMLLNARNSSNTAQNLLRNGKCAINFVTDDKKTFKEVVRLGWPGEHMDEINDKRAKEKKKA